MRHAFAFLLPLVTSCATIPDDTTVTPQRPTFSSDTSTTLPGSFEVEAGISVDPGDHLATPPPIKHGLNASTEVFVALPTYTSVDVPGLDADGRGDTLIGMRNRFWEGPGGTSAAFLFSTKLPTADHANVLGSGELDFFAAVIGAHSSGSTALVTYYELGILGDPARTGTNTQHLFALAGSQALPAGLGVFAELAHIRSPGGFEPLIATLGATKAVHRTLTLDAGVALGLNDDAPDAQFIVGLTANLGQLRSRSMARR